MTGERQYTNRCACGWEVTGSEDEVVATREQVLAALHAPPSAVGEDRSDVGAA